MSTTPENSWDIQKASFAYNIEQWGAQYFNVNEKGHIEVSPLQDKGCAIDLMEVVEEAKSRGLHFPLLVRFQDLLRHRVEQLNKTFQSSIQEYNYQGQYCGVFPIKVNQLREVVEEILDAGKPYSYGLEVGSKPELFAGLAMMNNVNALIIVNGYKDSSIIEMALLGRKLGKKVIMVVEKLEELRQIIHVSKAANTEPYIGVRVRLQAKGAGKWAESGGEGAKFGLTTAELLEAMDLLKSENMLKSFKLLHFHIGSQIPDILTIKRAVREAARYYAKLYKLGCPLEYIDVGGGLGVDYDGSRSSFESSINYTLQEYTNDVVYNILEIANSEAVPHPNIVSESGRAIVAHHSVLVVDVFGSIQKDRPSSILTYNGKEHPLVQELVEIKRNLPRINKLEAFHDALQRKEDAQDLFNLGYISLEDKAKVENLHWEISRDIFDLCKGEKYLPPELAALQTQLSDQYLCNFSIFQSLLDHWALDQLFPIVPIHRLNEAPTQQGTLVDITCDSDGKIDKFVGDKGGREIRETLPLHRSNGDPYYLGIFLMGAYQDIMGDLHNLFGRVNEVHLFLDPDEPSGYYFEEVIKGTTISQVLGMIQYNETDIVRQMKAQVDLAIKEDRVKPSEGMRLLDRYEEGLKEYTYLNFIQPSSSNVQNISPAAANVVTQAPLSVAETVK